MSPATAALERQADARAIEVPNGMSPATGPSTNSTYLSSVVAHSRSEYARRVTGQCEAPRWWTAIVITASSARQAGRYADEIDLRREGSLVPEGVCYLTVPDLNDARMGSGGATLHALRTLAEACMVDAHCASLENWWEEQRVLVIHSGGDSRRLPQYSLSGKLFSALPVKTPWGDVSTVFDEILTLSTAWVARLSSGLVVTSGDVVLTFDERYLHWDRTGVCGVAMREPMEEASNHGVFVADEHGRIYSFLQKPTVAQVRAAGGLLDGNRVALDTGLLRFDTPTAACLSALAGVTREGDRWVITDGILARSQTRLPEIDLYEHFARALTGEWQPTAGDAPALRQLSAVLREVPFWCDTVDGDFTHVGSTALFRRLMTEESDFSRLYEAHQRLGVVAPRGVRSAGVVVDCVLAPGTEIGPGALAIECNLTCPVRIGAGAILHGANGTDAIVLVPDDTVIHQVPIKTPDGLTGVVVRVYGVADNPKGRLEAEEATWFGRPIMQSLQTLGLDPETVWLGVPLAERSLWNARLFPLMTLQQAWRHVEWVLGQSADCSPPAWETERYLSLSESAQWADSRALADAQARRRQSQWQVMALELAESGSDIRPLLVGPPSITSLANVGEGLSRSAAEHADTSLTEAASLSYQASRFLAQAGLAAEAERARSGAFARVEQAVAAGVELREWVPPTACWRHDRVEVSAPARIDLGGGWSDTPPFCLDWGGTVLNVAISPNDAYPISTIVRRLPRPAVRCTSGDDGAQETYTTIDQILAPPEPGCAFSIHRVALQMSGLFPPGEPLSKVLARLGGGLEIQTTVALPMGSGLGTSSILGATVLRALAEMLGVPLTDLDLSDLVMCLEQRMTTGGGWQDQAGGIFPGVKLVRTGPGQRQRLRVEYLARDAGLAQDLAGRLLLYYTGIRRIAKDLLAQVVGSYLARETATVQALHSIKTLAEEMRYALQEGDWAHLGYLVDRHWQLNQRMDPNTTNAPINDILSAARPYVVGAKLAGAGGGGFLMLLTKDPDAAHALRVRLSEGDLPGAVCDYVIADKGLAVRVD